MEKEVASDSSDHDSMLYEEEPKLHNVFAKGKRATRPTPFRSPRQHHASTSKEALPHHALPKMQFPKFDGSCPKVWIDKCNNYFNIYGISKELKVEAVVMHLEENATNWWQAYKQNHQVTSWTTFCVVVQKKFGADDCRTAITDMLSLKQTGTVEKYTAAF